MERSKLMDLLEPLKKSNREISAFEKFVKSDFFNTNQRLVVLLDYIKKYWKLSKERQKKAFEKEAVFSKVFAEYETFDSEKMNQCASDLSRLLERYYAIAEFEENIDQKEVTFIRAAQKRGLDKYFFVEAKKYKNKTRYSKKNNKLIERELLPDSDKIRYLYEVNHMLYFHPKCNDHFNVKQKSLLLEELNTFYNQLDHFIRLNLSCELFTRHKKYEEPICNEQVKHLIVQSKKLAKTQIVNIYCGILDLFLTPDPKQVSTLKEMVYKYFEEHDHLYQKRIGKKNGKALLIFFMNAIPRNTDNLLDHYVELYRFALRKKFLMEDGLIDAAHVMNIIDLCCHTNRYALAEKFMARYSSYFGSNEKEITNIKDFISAYMLFNKKEFFNSYSKIYNLPLKNVDYGIRNYQLQLMTIVEGDKELGKVNSNINFHDKCQAFKSYLINKNKRGAISQLEKKANFNFINLSKKIYAYKYYGIRKYSKDDLLAELHSFEVVARKMWLEKTIRALK